MHIRHSEREQLRDDFPQTFLNDFSRQAVSHGADPYNRIGLNFGFNVPRALEIMHRRVFQ